MARYLMSSHGAARVTEQPPGGCQYVGTVTADGVCYRVLRAEDKTLYAARAESIFLTGREAKSSRFPYLCGACPMRCTVV